MTPLMSKRYDIADLQPWANRDIAPVVQKHKYDGRACGGKFNEGLLEGMGWIATQDSDGQIEMSLSYRNRRPNNYEVMRAFATLGFTYIQEESRKVGKVRHFVVQGGLLS